MPSAGRHNRPSGQSRTAFTKLYADDLLGHGPDDFAREVIAHDEGEPVYRLSTYSPLRGMTGDMEALALYAGQVCGQVKHVRPAREVVHEMMDEAHSVLGRLGSLK
ncbi:hypothetical protein [Rhizobium sp. TH2]|uniref:hypothetical protein n=1 Tax=Rhizobium sp. TH2 TaxID=2775403 RepID=UPI0021574283|nr:hypothetical protein [Rhizobium sp. TH2]